MYVSQELPLLAMSIKHRVTGNERELMKVEKLRKFVTDTTETYVGFDHFTSNTWSYEQNLSQ